MHFTRPELDEPLLRELYSFGILNQGLYAQWDEQSQTEGTLTGLLMRHGTEIDSSRWIFWLCSRYNFTRIPNLEPDLDFFDGLTWSSEREQEAVFYGCYPLKVRDGNAYLASIRPDIVSRAKPILDWLGAERAFFLALTPSEIKLWSELNRTTV